jgi:hypothetical protein
LYDTPYNWASPDELVGCRKSRRTARVVLEYDTCDAQEFKTNLSGSVLAHRVSRIAGGDFILLIPDSLGWMAANGGSFVKGSATSTP